MKAEEIELDCTERRTLYCSYFSQNYPCDKNGGCQCYNHYWTKDCSLELKRKLIDKMYGARATHRDVITDFEIDFIEWFEKTVESEYRITKRK